MSCPANNHRYFVADVCQCGTSTLDEKGKVVLIVLCTACGESFSKEFFVTSKNKNNKEIK